MGLFGKDRAGTFKATDGSGRRFTWTVKKFSDYEPGMTLDSDNVTCFSKTKFHLHMSLGSSGDVGVYIHYKKPPIPKYSYYFENSKKQVLRQHTAHTIPTDSERCGHWNVCNHNDMKDFLGEEDTLYVHFAFDDDNIVVKRMPEKNTLSVMWTIPNLNEQNVNPFSSQGFFIDSTLLVARIDVKRSNADTMAKCDPADINTYIIFLFCRKGKVPPHSVDLIDASGNSYFRAERNEDGTAQTVMVDSQLVQTNTAKSGILFVKFEFFSGGNPLESLGMGGGAPAPSGGEDRTVELGSKKEAYNVMDD
ncbi:hypothetical protein ABB37_07111 [Leptomonas pyrrhocoris]|uniref:Uncharacterized protein n=1 Tax=Leptomonas pyrrhocoris TaxID=157538 RepID=A0A0M9FWA0_LEPPY|nr:hypothetical protein ABB37_07111 [Leptomonas pyrrhocoris]KPA77196.1 hypothetical protein ABB37_07111 [Leptomonas pyrrhocoris]|eukprot:XP_015655635.1 hypothetical protein ABB37_07111 [Leptomonas pyrrhocoris]